MQFQATKSILLGTVISAIIGWIALQITKSTGIAVPNDFIIMVGSVLTGIVASFIPDSVKNIIGMLDDNIVREAIKDPASNVSSDFKA